MKLGILGAGKIAAVMAQTVRALRAAGNETVELYAAASREQAKAERFAAENGVEKAYGSYQAMLEDPAVDLVYIATPHSHHYGQIKLCAEHGKHVLCEKAFTVSARQAQDALAFARSRDVLVTEAIWTRYQPMRAIIRQTVDSGEIGAPRLLTANLGYMIEDVPRIARPELAGGALLDVGVYTLNFAEMVFGRACCARAVCTKNENGVDLTDSIALSWPDGRAANLTAAATAISDRQGVIYGTEGFVIVENINNPQTIAVYDAQNRLVRTQACPPQLTGYEYELLETVDCIHKGLLECPSMPHRETIHMMELMDHLRAQMGVCFPCEALDGEISQ